MNNIFLILKREFFKMLPPTIFFFVILHIILYTRILMAQQYDIPVPSIIAATIGALIIGKAILISNALPFINLFRQNRLIYNVIWRIILYLILIFIFQLLEELISSLSNHETVSQAIHHIFTEIKWHRFWATYILLIVFLTFYNVSTEIVSAMGRDRCINLFFGKKAGI